MKYWHEKMGEVSLPPSDFEKLLSEYERPAWCKDTDALKFRIGCQNLCFRRHKISVEFCDGCDMFDKEFTNK